jgi:hypothetical protein
VAAGLTETEAQRAAIGDFGPVRSIVYAHQTRHGRVCDHDRLRETARRAARNAKNIRYPARVHVNFFTAKTSCEYGSGFY